ncbi:MAG: hypothetical protein AAFR27_00440 [Pseudomonadota bacterium]
MMLKRTMIIALFSVFFAGSVWADAHPPRFVEPQGDGPYLKAVGEIETVFDWSEDSCDPAHIPDLPTRAFRDADDQIQLIVAHYDTRRMSGPDFDTLTVSCDLLMRSTGATDPSLFADKEWISGLYTEDGKTVHALVHNEFQGNAIGGAVCPSGEYIKCWYNSITYTRSDNSAASFTRPFDVPDHIVATLPFPYEPDAGVAGAFSPSNIIKHEGYYYAFFKAQTRPDGDQHVCLMRTQTLDDPGSWVFWTVFGFDGKFADPYRSDEKVIRQGQCQAIDLPDIAQMYEGVVWNTALQKFVLVGTSNDPQLTPNPFGFYYAVSDDLINWERRQPLLEVRLPWRARSPVQAVYLYPTIIDHDSPTRNFETADEDMYLYFTRLNKGQSGLDRDLVRVRVEVVK